MAEQAAIMADNEAARIAEEQKHRAAEAERIAREEHQRATEAERVAQEENHRAAEAKRVAMEEQHKAAERRGLFAIMADDGLDEEHKTCFRDTVLYTGRF